MTGLIIGTVLFFLAAPVVAVSVCYALNKRDNANPW